MSIVNEKASALASQIQDEVRQYTTELVQIADTYDYSQHRLVRRIALFESHTYPTGKFDQQGNYKYWFDGISPRVANEVKNIDFNTSDVKIFSDRSKGDDLAVLLANLTLKEYMRDTGQDEEFNSAVEEGSGWGNVVWKKIKKSYERVDLRNFYVINQTAQTLADTPVIERHQMNSSDLRAKMGVWDNVDEVLKNLQSDSFKSEIQQSAKTTTVPYYEIFERNGEVCLKDLKEATGKKANDGDQDKYVQAKVIGAGKKSPAQGIEIEYILFAEAMPGKDNSDIYLEFHRGAYKGRWFREGLFELLFDGQVRLNQIGNQIAQGLTYASRVLFRSEDKLIIQNVLTGLKNGDIIRSKDLQQVNVTLQGFGELLQEWNTIQQMMNDIANSSPIVTGEGMPQRMPFQVAALLNQNSNKLFDIIRQKLSIPFTRIFEEWVVPELVKDLTANELLRLTGDASMLDRIKQMVVDDWYVNNLIAIGPHGQEIADFLKQQQLDALGKRQNLLMEGIKKVFKDFQPSVSVVIAGENSTLPQDMATYSTFIALEQDPVRRSAMIEQAMSKKGIDVASLPKSDPGTPSPLQPDSKGKVPSIDGTPKLPARPTPPVRGKAA
jgi:hypothetical protein